jgi:hypothetical protein
MALHKPKQLYVLGKLRFSSIKPMKMIEIWLKDKFNKKLNSIFFVIYLKIKIYIYEEKLK